MMLRYVLMRNGNIMAGSRQHGRRRE